MTDLFTSNKAGQFCTHRKTGTRVLIKKTEWYKNILHYSVLVPIYNEKEELTLCDATYSESELIL